MTIIYVLIFVIMVIAGVIYYMLFSARNKARAAYSHMEAKLRKRWEVAPSLAEAVRGFEAYEEETLEKLEKLKEQKYDEFQILQKIEIDNNISKVVTKMIEISENYPDLKADKQYLKVSNELMDLDEEIRDTKAEYIESVRTYNTIVEKIPYNIIAILFGFNEEEVKI